MSILPALLLLLAPALGRAEEGAFDQLKSLAAHPASASRVFDGQLRGPSFASQEVAGSTDPAKPPPSTDEDDEDKPGQGPPQVIHKPKDPLSGNLGEEVKAKGRKYGTLLGLGAGIGLGLLAGFLIGGPFGLLAAVALVAAGAYFGPKIGEWFARRKARAIIDESTKTP